MKLRKTTALSFGVIILTALPFDFLEAVKDKEVKRFEKLRVVKDIKFEDMQGASGAENSKFEKITRISKDEKGNIEFQNS
ncbi:MAG TPA: hypothetical protein PLY23_09465 [Alphaproteobacteria bacterium]|nr:hypothetical protein [Alphaproteobacteria bacterium]HQS94833.1 hypothetical protein [Alphaproteobacteria bacterium]